MSGLAPDSLPSTRKEWETKVTERKLGGQTIHAAELASGPKIGYDQFLLLRVLWVTYGLGVSLPKTINGLLPRAVEMLADYPSWKTYCDNFNDSKNPEGSFSVARHYQKMAANSKGNIRPNTFDTPVALRTRSKRNVQVPDISKLQLNPPETPTKLPQTPVLSPAEDDWVLDDEESPPTPITPAAKVPEDLQKLMFPPTKDEQIVNTALVVFLNALTIHFGVSETCNWTMHRKGFVAKFAEASFEARTDGYLDDGQENAYALIEVKPVIRRIKRNLIQMQESAQMVGWIMNDTDKNNIDKMRVHVSQDRHEIFLTFAEYENDYLAYLKTAPSKPETSKTAKSENKSSENQKSPFMTMHQYGPWDTRNSSHMKQLGPILLAIALYADSEIRAKQKSQNR
ncbi:hypothetical protein BO78DRAFT_426928 [Aspergillus sclerotiicarbonarius CBS 121057]|uniref:Uncharacterized protein n=1 Tax=Aspergillus sclerotiicarbonarius (strain CBS 121057 / IBT 28362) TaxID=1448318 RepID=A0A319F386_ASPSB|nr:hypothetical protein BO78DRAFT_426928 [Aspergillus sclerotiicarbonarius CBS 121057]